MQTPSSESDPLAFPIMSCVEDGHLLTAQLSLWLIAFLTWPPLPATDPAAQALAHFRRQSLIDAVEQRWLQGKVHQLRKERVDLASCLRTAKRIGSPLASTCEAELTALKYQDKLLSKALHSFIDRSGLETVVEASPITSLLAEVVSAASIWVCAGRRLYIAAQLEVHHEEQLATKRGPRGSIGKARAVLKGAGFQRRHIDHSWHNLKGVAHIAAGALQAAGEADLGVLEVIWRDPTLVLERALAFQWLAWNFRCAFPSSFLVSSFCVLPLGGMRVPRVNEFIPPLSSTLFAPLTQKAPSIKGY